MIILWILLIVVALPVMVLSICILRKMVIEWSVARKNRVTPTDIAFLQAVVAALPPQYAFLKKQAQRTDLWQSKQLTYGSGENRYELTVRINPAGDFRDRTMPYYFLLQNIRVNRRDNAQTESVALTIHEGLLIAWQTTVPVKELDIAAIDTSALQELVRFEKRPDNEDKKKLLKILKGAKEELLSLLELDDTFAIEIAEGLFYPVKQYDDGNYLAVDSRGAVFLLVHDPWTVKKLFPRKEEFFEAMENGTFDLENAMDEAFK